MAVEDRVEDRLLTRYAGAPHVTMRPHETMVEFDSSLVEPDGLNWVTTLRFKGVTDFRFAEDPGGADGRLVEIVDSPVVVVRPELHHYRIAFQEHGVYDIIGTEMDIFADRAAHA